MTKQVIKRNSKSFIFEAMRDTSTNKAGDTLYIIKGKNGGYYGINNRTGATFQMLRAHMNIKEVFKLVMQWDYYSNVPDELAYYIN